MSEISRCRRGPNARKATLGMPPWRGVSRPGGVEDPRHAQRHLARESGEPTSGPGWCQGPPGEPPGDTTMMDRRGRSDSPIVSETPPNNHSGAPGRAEGVERRGLAKGNVAVHPRDRTQCRSIPVTGARPRTAGPRVPARHHPRQEPGAGKPHAGICAGGAEQSASLPRPVKTIVWIPMPATFPGYSKQGHSIDR